MVRFCDVACKTKIDKKNRSSRNGGPKGGSAKNKIRHMLK